MFLIHWIWCLPQTLLALIYRMFLKVERKEKRGHAIIYYIKNNIAVSLGHRIFIQAWRSNDEYLIKHEIGHYKQSLMLGCLYLLVIGLPSGIWNLWGFNRALKKNPNISYYDYWCEAWADKLGGNKGD